MLTMPILMLFYMDMGFTTEQAFRLKAIYSISIVVFEIPSGYIADVLGRRTTLILGAILGTLGFLFYSIGTTFWWFVAAEVTLGIGQSFISGADSAMLYDSLKHQQKHNKYTRYDGITTSIGNFSEAIGAVVGGALAEISLRTPFIWQTAIAFIAIPAAFTLVEPTITTKRKKAGIKDILRVVHYALISNKSLRWSLFYSSIIGAATLTMAWVYQLQLNAFEFSEFYIGLSATILNFLVGMVTLLAYKAERSIPPRYLISLITVIITGGFVAAGISSGPVMLLAVLFIFYAARGIATPVLKNYINVLADSDVRATVLSIRSLIIRAFFAVIAPLFGWMADMISLNQALTIIGIVFVLVVTPVIFLFIKDVEKNLAHQRN